MRILMGMALLAGLAACGPDRREADARVKATEAAIADGVAAREAARVAAAVPAGPPPGMAPTPMTVTSLACEDGSQRTLRYFPEQGIAILMPEGKGKELQPQPVASGVGYAGADIEVRGKGTSFMITLGDSAPVACTAAG